MRKHIISSLMLTLSILPMSAECVVSVYDNGGQKISYALSDSPTITTTNREVVITTQSETLTYAFAEFGKLVTEEGTPTPPNSLEEIRTSSWDSGEETFIYSLEGNNILDLKNAKPGFYVVKKGNTSVKILKK